MEEEGIEVDLISGVQAALAATLGGSTAETRWVWIRSCSVRFRNSIPWPW